VKGTAPIATIGLDIECDEPARPDCGTTSAGGLEASLRGPMGYRTALAKEETLVRQCGVLDHHNASALPHGSP